MRPVLVLEEQELHHGKVGHGVVDHPFEKDDAILEEQVAECHLALSRIVAIALKRRIGERVFKRHGTILRNQGPVDGGHALSGIGSGWVRRVEGTSRSKAGALRLVPLASGEVHDPSSAFSDFDVCRPPGRPPPRARCAVMSRVSTARARSRPATVFDRAGFQDAVEDFAFEDLGRQVVGHPFLFEPGADPADTLAGPLGHRFELHRDVRILGFDLLGFGNLGQEQEFLERLEGRLVGIGFDVGFPGTDVVVGDAFLAELRDQPPDRVGLLAGDQVGREVERRLLKQAIEDLPPEGLPLLEMEPALEGIVHRLAKVLEALEADRVRNAGFDIGEAHLLQVVDADFHREGRASQAGIAAAVPILASTWRVSPGLMPANFAPMFGIVPSW